MSNTKERGVGLLLRIREDVDVPIYMQIRNQMIQGIASGELKPEDQLPTVRALALEIGINAMTVNKAYQLLKQEGYIYTDRRNGARVCEQNSSELSLNPVQLMSLRQIVAEAKVVGMSKEELVRLCEQYYMGEE